MHDVPRLLRAVSIFREIDPDELGEVAGVCREEKFKSAESIFREVEPGNRLYLAEGEVRSRRRWTNDSLRSLPATSVF